MDGGRAPPWAQEILAQLDSVHTKLNAIHAQVIRIATEEDQLMATLTDLQAEVSRNTDVDQSAITLLNGLTAKIQQLIDAGADPAAFQKLADDLKASTDQLAAAVAANTPAAP